MLTVILLLLCFSCKEHNSKATQQVFERDCTVVKSEFQSIIDSSDVIGSILIFDLNKSVYYSNDFKWAKTGKLPASTFKIPNTIVGLETGVIRSDSTIFKWDGEEKWLKAWEQDLVLKDAFQFSCVPCYQEVAREIGVDRMNDYIKILKYGTLDIDSVNIDNFWLEGKSRITQFQQIDFLKRFYKNELPISRRTSEIVKSILLIKNTDHYRLSGKTGLSNVNEDYNGWFVGYLEQDNNTYFFATNLEPKGKINLDSFIKKRLDVTTLAFEILNIID
ncbi:class D beta-lactamase [Maribacter hydrothermalis]|uniref:Beta-lactamase n=2 Tax=Maribacter hydrothermalis TaxID=1836467 RepID=A0A1B7Z148_9FLAO|nr:class D beta-lactamase [Maribacter hydrothermalis]APQ18073.1 class D beta-lactamase [Maribacter hydrothermalis]OBR36418.1 class D beta-lactamase [Maribacter hydrothermalis]